MLYIRLLTFLISFCVSISSYHSKISLRGSVGGRKLLLNHNNGNSSGNGIGEIVLLVDNDGKKEYYYKAIKTIYHYDADSLLNKDKSSQYYYHYHYRHVPNRQTADILMYNQILKAPAIESWPLSSSSSRLVTFGKSIPK